MDVDQEVKKIIAKTLNLPVEQLSDDTGLQDLGAESLDVIEMIFEIEEKFDIEMTVKMSEDAASPDGKSDAPSLADFSTISDICRAVRSIVDAKAA